MSGVYFAPSSRSRMPGRCARPISYDAFSVLTVPGWQGSGPAHWQSIWERKFPGFSRVEQSDWHRPHPNAWVQTLGNAIKAQRRPVVLVAHSLGCIAVARWAETASDAGRVTAALLVAPPDLRSLTKVTEPLRHFAPVPQSRVPFRSLLVGSEDDPYMTLAAARDLAANWGCGFMNAGRAGHINCTAGFGAWPQGEAYLEGLAASSELDAIAAISQR